MKHFILTLISFFLFLPGAVFALSSSENYQLELEFIHITGDASSENYQSGESVAGQPQKLTQQDSQETIISLPEEATASSQETTTSVIVSKIQQSVSGFLETSGINEAIEEITANKTIQENKDNLATAVAALTGAVAAVPLAANLPASYSMANLLHSLFPFLGRRRKSQYWGKVFDAESRQPIIQAIVRIYHKETKKVLQTQITDKDGRFDLLIAPGEYYLEVFKENYTFPSKLIPTDYHGEILKIREGHLLGLNIPLDPQLDKVANRIKSIWNLKKVLESLYYPLLFIGTILSLIFYLKYGDLNNLLILILYLVILLYEFYKGRRSRPYGLVLDQDNKNPLDLAIVRIFTQPNGKLISTKVTDAKGKFTFLVNQGQYQLTVLRQDYQQYKSQILQFKSSTLVNIDVPLTKIEG